jgi:hypothetical protein
MTLLRNCLIKAWLAGGDAIPKPAGSRLRNSYPNGPPLTGLFRVISSLTASQGFVFSLFQTRGTSNARTFQVE